MPFATFRTSGCQPWFESTRHHHFYGSRVQIVLHRPGHVGCPRQQHQRYGTTCRRADEETDEVELGTTDFELQLCGRVGRGGTSSGSLEGSDFGIFVRVFVASSNFYELVHVTSIEVEHKCMS